MTEWQYAAPAMVSAFLSVPAWSVLPGIYAKYHGVSLGTIAAILLTARIFDGICDPIVGGLYDGLRKRHRNVTKPLVLIGGALFAITCYFLYAPPVPVGASYLLILLLIFYLTQTLFEIPHLAWAGKLANSSAEKTQIFAVRVSSIYIGSLFFFGLPWLPIFASTAITPDVLSAAALIGIVCTLPAMLAILPLPDGEPVDGCRQSPKGGRYQVARLIFYNRPMLVLYAAHFLATLGKSMSFGLMFFYVDTYLGLGAALTVALGTAMITGLVSVGVWTRVARRIGRKRSWCAGMAIMAVTLMSLVILEPGQTTATTVIVLLGLNYIGYVTASLFSFPLIAEAADYGVWKFGEDASGLYFAIQNLVQKTSYGLGGAAGFAIAGWAGFDPQAQSQSADAMFGLHLAIAYIPAMLTMLSIGVIALLPLDGRRHSIIRQRLEGASRAAKAR